MMSGSNGLLVGSVQHLENGEQGLVFSIQTKNQVEPVPAFAIRFQDEIYVYKNICGHIAINLDFMEGQFFDDEGEHLICSTHGAMYQANTGKCLGGPCYGVGLEPIQSEVRDGELFVIDEQVAAIIEK